VFRRKAFPNWPSGRAIKCSAHPKTNTLSYCPRSEFRKLEQQQKFQEAYKLLSTLVPENDGHRKNLAALLAAISLQKASELRRDFAGGQPPFSSLLPLLDPVRDIILADYARSQLEYLQPLTLAESDREADSLMAVGDVQMARGDYAKAADTFQSVYAKRGSVSAAKAEAANQHAAEARALAANEPTLLGTGKVFLATIPQTLVRLLGWVPYAIAYVLLILIPLLLIMLGVKALRPRKEIRLSLGDRTGIPGPIADASVTEQMRRERDLPRPTGEGFRIDIAADDD
jgi:hypothetical protein